MATTISVNEFNGEPIELYVRDTGPCAGPAIVLCHGFPDLGTTWTHQIEVLDAAGYRAIAPDQRGYGRSSAPHDATAYGLGELTGDLIGLLDALEIDKAVFIGHDWGGFVAWAMPILHPDRVLGVGGVCTPYMPFPTTDLLRQLFPDPEKMYMLWFQEPGVAEGRLNEQVDLVFEKLFVGGTDPAILMERAMKRAEETGEGPDLNPFANLADLESIGAPLLSGAELQTYVDTFSTTGFAGGVNWYRNIDANAAKYPGVGNDVVTHPALMLCAEWDPVLSPAMAAGMPALCSDLEMHTIEQAGHFVQIEKPEAVSSLIVHWMQRRFPVPGGQD